MCLNVDVNNWVFLCASLLLFILFSPFWLQWAYSCLSCFWSTLAIEACNGLNHMGFPAHWEEYCRNRFKPFIGDVEELSGVVLYVFLHRLFHVTCWILTGFWVTWQASEFCNQFYQTYFLTIEQEIFAVLTDTFHKPGFKLHVLVLQHLFCLVIYLYMTSQL